MRTTKIFLYFTYGFVILAFIATAALYVAGYLSFVFSVLIVTLSVALNLLTYLYYRKLFLAQAEKAGMAKQEATAEFEKEFPSYRD